jgi:hypothetical protein
MRRAASPGRGAVLAAGPAVSTLGFDLLGVLYFLADTCKRWYAAGQSARKPVHSVDQLKHGSKGGFTAQAPEQATEA